MVLAIDSGFATAEPSPDSRVEIGVRLKRDLHTSFESFSLRARANGASISVGNGWLA